MSVVPWLRLAAGVCAVHIVLGGAVVAPAAAGRPEPSGRCERLLVYREGVPLTASRIMGVPESGGVAHTVYDGPLAELDPDWSPDGRQLVFATRVNVGGVVSELGLDVLDVTTGEVRTLLRQDPSFVRFPAWSPDGRAVAYVSAKGGPGPLTALRIVRSDGSDDRLVTLAPDGHVMQDVVWDPRGDRLLVSSRTADFRWTLWSVDPDTGVRVTLDDSRDLGYPRFFEHKRSRLVVEGSELDASGASRATLYLTHPKRLEPLVRLFDEPEDQWGPAISPDGDEVAYLMFSSHPTEPNAVKAVSLEDGAVREVVAPLPGFPFQFVREGLSWQPAGRCVAGFPY